MSLAAAVMAAAAPGFIVRRTVAAACTAVAAVAAMPSEGGRRVQGFVDVGIVSCCCCDAICRTRIHWKARGRLDHSSPKR